VLAFQDSMTKEPFNIDRVMRKLRKAVESLPRATMHVLADEGYRSVFEQLVACMISVRTREETTLVVARRVFGKARTAAEVLKLGEPGLRDLLRGSTFSEAKAPNILELSRRIVADHGGEPPCDRDVLLSFPGIGPKCANLILSVACKEARIGVDIHVHRVTSRWGYVHTKTPEQTLLALEKILPKKYWAEINLLLVPFGRTICTGQAPHCSTCPILSMCRQVGVTSHR
jgi:endonuclease III